MRKGIGIGTMENCILLPVPDRYPKEGEADDRSCFREPQKQDVFVEGYREVFTPVPKTRSVGRRAQCRVWRKLIERTADLLLLYPQLPQHRCAQLLGFVTGELPRMCKAYVEAGLDSSGARGEH